MIDLDGGRQVYRIEKEGEGYVKLQRVNAATLRKLQRVPLEGEESVPLEGEGNTLRYRGRVILR